MLQAVNDVIQATKPGTPPDQISADMIKAVNEAAGKYPQTK
jgi:hypothetical protein